MSDLVIQPVTTGRQKRRFVQFPWSLYRNDPCWIPPLRSNLKEMANYRPHPFYENAAIQTFLAVRKGEVCGRIGAIENRWHLERYNDGVGFFGFFECVDDQEVANGLFDAARAWLGERGIQKIRGPVSPSLNYEVGLLIDGFDSPPTFMMAYNRPYYARLLEGYGFRKVQDLYAYEGHVEMLPRMRERYEHIVEHMIKEYGLRLRSLDTSRFVEEVEGFLTVFNRSLTNTWGFVPMSPEEIRHVARGLRYLIVPELAVGVEIDGQLIGAVFCLPDFNPRIKAIDGRLFPFGFLRLLWNKEKIKKVRILSANVLPEYQLQGLGLVLMHGLLPKALECEIERAEFSWVLESNSLSRGSLEKGGTKRTKTYRLYDLDPQKADCRGNP
jgi:GNAT superfamily N-acetyltransferase